MFSQLQVRTGHSSMSLIWDQSTSYAGGGLKGPEAPYWWFCIKWTTFPQVLLKKKKKVSICSSTLQFVVAAGTGAQPVKSVI